MYKGAGEVWDLVFVELDDDDAVFDVVLGVSRALLSNCFMEYPGSVI